MVTYLRERDAGKPAHSFQNLPGEHTRTRISLPEILACPLLTKVNTIPAGKVKKKKKKSRTSINFHRVETKMNLRDESKQNDCLLKGRKERRKGGKEGKIKGGEKSTKMNPTFYIIFQFISLHSQIYSKKKSFSLFTK